METIKINQSVKAPSNVILWTGRTISGLCVLFLLTDSVMKIALNHYHVDGTQQLQWSVNAVQPIGIVLLICTVVYIIPRTAVLGAILLTGYLGGAIATMARIGVPFYFPLILAVLVWLGLYLRNEALRKILS